MVELEIDGQKVQVPEGAMVMDAATQLGIYVPHFCYHHKLSIAANCRMCLVDVEKRPNRCLPVPLRWRRGWWCVPAPSARCRRRRG